MKIHMYEHFPNFGDALNKHLWSLYFDKWLKRNDDILMFGIGTLLGQKIEHKGRVIVCGSGCGYEPDIEAVRKNWKIFFVRGPRTASILQLPNELAITDPAILTPECFPKAPPSGRVAFIPHWETSRNPLWNRVCASAEIDYIDPLAPVADVVAKISAAKMVITEAMHGAIIADAYRVPFVPVSTSPRINHFKWQDWAESLSIPFAIEHLKPLGMSDILRAITADTKTARKLRKSLPQATANSIEERMSLPLSMLNRLYSYSLPLKLRYRVEYYTMCKLGPRIDSWIAKTKFGNKQIDNSAEILLRLSKLSGWQSDEKIAEAKRSQVLEKLHEVQQFLGD